MSDDEATPALDEQAEIEAGEHAAEILRMATQSYSEQDAGRSDGGISAGADAASAGELLQTAEGVFTEPPPSPSSLPPIQHAGEGQWARGPGHASKDAAVLAAEEIEYALEAAHEQLMDELQVLIPLPLPLLMLLLMLLLVVVLMLLPLAGARRAQPQLPPHAPHWPKAHTCRVS